MSPPATSPSKLLSRQLRSTLGVESIDALRQRLGPEASVEQLRAVAQALPDLLQRIETAYLDLARDVALVQRSLDLSSAELIAAREAAEAANRAKSRFLANVSHELRTPINGLAGMAQLLLERSQLTRDDRGRVEVMDRSTRALQAIISDLLDWAQVDAERVRLVSEPFSVRELLRDVLLLLDTTASHKGLQLRGSVAVDVPDWLLGDAGRVRQILLNLVGNALKFTDQGHVTVLLDGQAHTGQFELRGQVMDTGPGIAEADRLRIFQPFQQADSSITRRHGGTGLGLAISAHLARLMGGELTLHSQRGQGSTFSFTALLAQVPATDVEASPTAPPATATQATDLSGLRVLVVEDNHVNQVVARAQLEHLGCQVTLVETGEAALALPVPLPFDLVLLDLNMPGVSGLTVARSIRAREQALSGHPPVFICALTANASEEDRQAALAAGMDEHLAKPARLENLDLLLHRVRPR